MHELISRINEMIADLKKTSSAFMVKKISIDQDISRIGQELSGSRTGADQNFIDSLVRAREGYQQAAEILHSVTQQLENLISRL